MASSVRTVPRRLGQLSAQARRSLPLQPRLSSPRSPLLALSHQGLSVKARSSLASARLYATSSKAVEGIDSSADYKPLDAFPHRHIGPEDADVTRMLEALSPPAANLDEFVSQVIPADILTQSPMKVGVPKAESTLKGIAEAYAKSNRPSISFIGQGYYDTHTPAVIQRNVLENPAWYTSYTPYQPEISQGRLESLVNYQTMVSDLTALPFANASLLDEGTAAAEAMTLSLNTAPSSRAKRPNKTFVVSTTLHPQTLAVMRGRADGFGIKILSLDLNDATSHGKVQELGDDLIGVMVQYPDTLGGVHDYHELAELVHKQGAPLSVATDLLALTRLKPPGEWGADIAFGSAQRLGVPLGFGGPHAAFFAVADKYKRKIPGRLVGLSKDRLGDNAYRLALQTREQHIRREKATSNVCTAQALLANMSALYAVYHGPEGLKEISQRIVRGAQALHGALSESGFKVKENPMWDTIVVELDTPGERTRLDKRLEGQNIEVRRIGNLAIGISIDETTTFDHLVRLLHTMRKHLEAETKDSGEEAPVSIGKISRSRVQKVDRETLKTIVKEEQSASKALLDAKLSEPVQDVASDLKRTSSFLTHPVFNTHHSETEILRYIHHLQSKDLSLVHSMIPLGSCTMKLNGTTEMSLISLPNFSKMHPFTSVRRTNGYLSVLKGLSKQLAGITGMDVTSLQPNSGAQGEFAGLRAIRSFHVANAKEGEKARDICLIPVSAHGTNPASAAMAGMRVVPVKCHTKTGNLDIEDLTAKCEQYRDELGAIMVTYPSTYGVFEPEIRKVCEIVHEHGGQVYMDGANMNAQIGLCSPGEIGADVCHLNLHKTFCIPHGGGGPGVGPICVKKHLARHLPQHPLAPMDESKPQLSVPVSSAKYGSASINLISWAYNVLMGDDGLKKATKLTLLNANYLLARLKPHYEILYTNENGRCAHEFILDVRPFRESAGVEAIDIAKRLQDYGFHAPTMSWPVANTLMIEPTESESKEELDRFVEALVNIRQEIREVEEGTAPRQGNVLKMAPHPMKDLVLGDEEGGWNRSYSRAKAAYPVPWLKEKKFWPSVGRIDDTYGDSNLFCTCPPVEDTTGDI